MKTISLIPPPAFVDQLHEVENPILRPRVCSGCGAKFEGIFAQCPACVESMQKPLKTAEHQQDAEEQRRARVNAWLAMCPPDYRSTSWQSHPELSPVCRRLAKEWKLPGKEAGNCRGLLITGPTGLGKTRAMFEILQRLHFGGVPCMTVEAVDYGAQAMMSTNTRASWVEQRAAHDYLHRAKTVRVLFFDDLGKDGGTGMPGFARSFHDLLEHRKAWHLPTLITTERVGDELAILLGTNYADGIVRRLREMCQIFRTEEQAQS